jgi:glutamyl-tRNA synthetase
MHLGNARTALLAWLAARQAGGAVVLRIEDLDRARVPPGAEAQLLDDLSFLGLDWDEGPDRGGPLGPYRQSERAAAYDRAVDDLLARGRAFLCSCSRADVARAASAPHGEDGPRYPGTCRDRPPADVLAAARAAGRAPTVRFRGGPAAAGDSHGFRDGVHGPVDPLGPDGLDDFVIRRADGVAAYQLAVVVDDAAMAITQVVRGDDLLASTPRQLALFRALGGTPPAYAHVPLLLAPGGERLAKRTRPPAIGDLRARGVGADVVVGALAASAGLAHAGVRLRPGDLLDTFSLDRLRRTAAEIDAHALGNGPPPRG